MMTKKCCYMDRNCSEACVAYSESEELSEGARDLGLSDMHCIRLFIEFTEMMNLMEPVDSEEFEVEDEF